MTDKYQPVEAYTSAARSQSASVNKKLKENTDGTHSEVIADQSLTIQAAQVVTVTAVNAKSAAVAATTNRVVLVATTNMWVKLGADPTAAVATAGSFYLAAGAQSYPLEVTAGVTKIAAIRDSADGYLSIIESN